MGREKVRISEVQSHNSRGNTKHPQLMVVHKMSYSKDGYGNEEQEEELS